MQDVPYLNSLIESAGGFRSKFAPWEKNPKAKLDAKIQRLQELHANRLRRAVETNLRESPIYGAIDKALEAAQDNLPYIQARQLANSGKTTIEIQKMFEDFGLKHMLEPVVEIQDGKVVTRLNEKKEPQLTFNVPLFETVFVPLVFAYNEMRIAKLFNDRNQFPHYKYSPSRLTMKDMLMSDIVTSRIQRMTAEMGYTEDEKQSIRQMAYYGICLNVIEESWYDEKYDTKDGDKVVTKIQREGVRFTIPHPSRHFWDRTVPLYRLNSDTGVQYFGFWDIKKWSDVKDNPLYWNTDKITYGGYDLFMTATWRIFQMFFPCTVEFPKSLADATNQQNPDRIAKEQVNFLKDELDASITQAVLFDKLIPKDWGLFDYDKPVWMRFVYANYNTCIHCEVIPYTPGCVYLDRYDANKTVAQSQGMQLTPFAQLLGNFLTQHFQSVKQNLLRVNWVNTDIMPADQINLLKRAKDKLYQGVHWLLYSKKHNAFPLGERGDQREAVTSMQNAQVDTQQLKSNIELTLMVVERILGISPQEVGQAASHEQSASEMSVISGSTSNSLEFMGTGVDSARTAKKRILYTAWYCYGDDNVFAEVADLTPEREAALRELGFEVEKGSLSQTHAGVSGKKAKLVMDSFLSDREGVTRLSDSKLGISMMQMLGQYAANPALLGAIGVKKFVELSMMVWRMVGLPSDFRIDIAKIQEMNPQAQQQEMLKMIAQLKDEIVKEAVTVTEQQIKQQVADPVTQEFLSLKQMLQQMQAQDQMQNEAIKRIMPIIEAVEASAHPAPPILPPQLPPQGLIQTQPQPAPLNAPAPVGPPPIASIPS